MADYHLFLIAPISSASRERVEKLLQRHGAYLAPSGNGQPCVTVPQRIVTGTHEADRLAERITEDLRREAPEALRASR